MKVQTKRALRSETNSFGQYVTREEPYTVYTGTVQELAALYPDHPYMIFRLSRELKANASKIAELKEAGCLPELKPWESLDDQVCVRFQLGRPEFCDANESHLERFELTEAL